MNCLICEAKKINIKKFTDEEKQHYDFLATLINHISIKFKRETLDDEKKAYILFQNLIQHCTPKGQMFTKKDLFHLYQTRIKAGTIQSNIYFEKLVRDVTNGELCVSCPSKAVGSCKWNCKFCIFAKGYAKSYMPGQAVFDHLGDNNGIFTKYMPQHLCNQHDSSLDISKLTMRHLGGTFCSYSRLYRHTYCRDIFYGANTIHMIIGNPELYSIAMSSKKGLFDPHNIIADTIRKPFNYEKIQPIEKKLNIVVKKMVHVIKTFQYKLADKIDETDIDRDEFNSIIVQIEKDIQGVDLQVEFAEFKETTSILMSNIASIETSLLEEMKVSLKMEQNYNVSSPNPVVALSVETRPDTISPSTLEEFRFLGVTIVELGLQSPNDEILRIIDRGHDVNASIKAIRMIKDNGFHVHGQWMMDLPGSTKESDYIDIIKIVTNKDISCDQIKVYPYLDLPGTEVYEMRRSGLYPSWVETDQKGFIEVISHGVSSIDETTRVNRIQRDLPKQSDRNPYGYTNDQPSNLEQIISLKLFKDNKTREDIRSHEPGIRMLDISTLKYYVDIKQTTGGTDIFISAQSYVCNNFRVIWGYCRLRIVKEDEDTFLIKFFKQNKDKKFGRIRELKVNGSTQAVGTQGHGGQHKGLGTKMLQIAEEMAFRYGMTHVTVTSSVGTRNYYKDKHNYTYNSESSLMWKKLPERIPNMFRLIRTHECTQDTKFQITYEKEKNNNYWYLFAIIILLIIFFLFY